MIQGIGRSSDGRGKAIYAPNANGQIKALRDTYAEAGVGADSIELVEAHGTGTAVGDAVEVDALTEVYRAANTDDTWCAIGSVKSMIGHTKAAAGVAGMIKAALALKYKVLPPTLKVDEPLVSLAPGTSPLYVNTIKRPWVSSPAHPRRAAVSAFGFGGSNFHCVLEEAEPMATDETGDGRVLIVAFSAHTKNALAEQLAHFDGDQSWAMCRAFAARSLERFDATRTHRLLIVIEQAQASRPALLADVGTMLANETGTSWQLPAGAYYGGDADTGKIGVLFPGQGSQYVGMLRDLACQFPEFTAELEDANGIQAGETEVRPTGHLSDVIYPVPVFSARARDEQAAKLCDTRYAQPAIGVVSLAAFRLLKRFGVTADIVAGHSYGELVALAAAGVFDSASLYRLSYTRGQLMAAQNGDRGAMLAVAVDRATAAEWTAAEKFDLVVANHNAPRQVVLSGATDDIHRAATYFNGQGIQTTLLPVSAAFHSRFVSGAEAHFAEHLAAVSLRPGTMPVLANTTAKPYPALTNDFDQAAIRTLLAGQLARPVRFVEQIKLMYERGVRTFIEVGPGSRLGSLVQAILGDRTARIVSLDASSGQRQGTGDLARLLATLAAAGKPVDLSHWDTPPQNSEQTPPHAPSMTIELSGANYVSTAQAPQPRAVTPPQRATTDDDAILALQKMQQQTADLHRHYLLLQETAQHTIAKLLGHDVPAPPQTAATAPPPPASPPPIKPKPVVAERNNTDGEIHDVLLEVVAEKTGYPREMLSLNMSLDTDLGIDSIKRVEILSALQERLPDLPTIDPDTLGTFQLLQNIVEFLLEKNQRTPAAIPLPPEATVDQVSAEPTTVQDDAQRRHAPTTLSDSLLAVVAEKTGYPKDMLTLNMHLESDLGIDSIKRVEILSALQDRVPNLPVIEADALTTLTTLAQIAEHLSATTADQVSAEPTTVQDDAQAVTAITRRCLTVEPLTTAHAPLDLAGGRIWINDADPALAELLRASFRKRRLDAEIVSAKALPNGVADALVIVAPHMPAADFMQDCLQLLQATADRITALVGVTQLGGHFGLDGVGDACPVGGGVAGLIKTADKEWPHVACKVIDIDGRSASETLADDVVDECLLSGALEVGLIRRDNTVWRKTPVLTETALSDTGSTPPLAPGEVVVISGGARGITSEIAVALACQWQAKLMLLGRSPEPTPEEPDWLHRLNSEADIKKALIAHHDQPVKIDAIANAYRATLAAREIRHTLARIREAGVEAIYRSVDIRDSAAVSAAVREARETLGNIGGVVHGAGVLADRLIKDKTTAQFNEVYRTKVDGVASLLAATANDPLKFIALLSSSTARFGRRGQCDYAAANEVLNKTAQQQAEQREHCRVVSVNWGPWDGGMVDEALKQVFAAEGVGVIPLNAGAGYLLQEIANGDAVEVVALGTPPATAKTKSEITFDTTFQRTLAIATHGFLNAHVIGGRATLPVAMMIEWLAHGAMHDNPRWQFHGFKNFRVFKGVTIDTHMALEVEIAAGDPFADEGETVVPTELRGANYRHAKAGCILTEERPSSPPKRRRPNGDASPRDAAAYYANRRLFHGELLRGLETIDMIDERMITARTKTADRPQHWMKNPVRSAWLTDPLALDSAFQLMIVWCFERLGKGSLPVAIGEYRQFRQNFPAAGCQITIAITEHTDNRAVADITFTDADACVIAEMRGYECVIDETLAAAFANNRLSTVASDEIAR